MEQWVIDYQKNINTALSEFFDVHYSWEVWHNEKILREAVMYTVMHADNSRIHAIVAMIAYEEFLWITAESSLPIIIGIDFLHIWLMLHADTVSVRNTYNMDASPTIKKYGISLSIVVWDILIALGIERLSESGNIQVIQEAVRSIGDSGYLRGIARDILTDHSVISQKEYLIMYDEKLARNIISAFIVWSLIAWDSSQLLRDQYKQFGTFLARIYQVGHDISLHEHFLENKSSELNRERGVVDFLWYERAKGLSEELYIELLRMTTVFQNPKFKDIITIFKEWWLQDI